MAVGAAAPILPGWGKVTPWVLRSGSQFRPDGPPALDSGRYARDYNEVREVGSLTSLTRTPEQTHIASFWRASPSVIWNTVARQVIDAQGLDLSASSPGVRAHVSRDLRRRHRLLGREVHLQLLAAHHGHPER